MLSPTEKKFSILFFTIVILELICGSIDSLAAFHYFTKPAILTALIIFFINQNVAIAKNIRNLTLLALVFSLLGDILLMFVNYSPNYFMLGLIAFLIAHLFYISVFLKQRDTSKKPYGVIAILLVYGLSVFYTLKDGLGEMLIPVIVYMLVILTMTTTAFLRTHHTGKLSYNLVLIGAVFFMISDSILAINKFHIAIPFSNISIMLTYALAQYLIVFGVLKSR